MWSIFRSFQRRRQARTLRNQADQYWQQQLIAEDDEERDRLWQAEMDCRFQALQILYPPDAAEQLIKLELKILRQHGIH